MNDQYSNLKCVTIEQLLTAPLRRKFLIMAIVAFSMFISIVYLSVTESEYRIIAQVRPGVTNYDNENNEIRGLSPTAIRSLLLNKGYLACLAQSSEYSRFKLPIRINAKVSPHSDIVTVSLITDQKEKGMALLGFIINCLSNDKHLLGSQIARSRLSSAIKGIELELKGIEIEKQNIMEKIMNLKRKAKSLNKAIMEIIDHDKVISSLKKEIDQKIEEFEAGVQTMKKIGRGPFNGPKVDIKDIIISNMLQQELEYAARLRSELVKINNQLRDDVLKIHNTQLQIANLELSVKELQVKKEKELKIKKQQLENKITLLKTKLNALRPLEIVMEPTGLPEPVSPNSKLVLVTTFSVSLLFSLFLAFYLEFFQTKPFHNKLN